MSGGVQSAVVRQVTQSPSSQNGCTGLVQWASIAHSSQLPSAVQRGVVGWLAQCVSVAHSVQILMVGWQMGLFPPPSAEQLASLVQLASQSPPTQICPTAQCVLSTHSVQLPVGRPAVFGRKSHRLSVVSSAQSASPRHSMQRLFGASQISPASQVAVPHGVSQSPLTHVAPAGQ